MATLRVGVLEDHALLLESLVLGLEREDSIEVVATFSDIDSLEAAADSLELDVLVADLEVGQRLGTEVVGETSRRLGARVLLMSGTGDLRGVSAALDAGCSGFISKGSTLEEVVQAVLTIGRGGAVFPNDVLGEVLNSGLERPGADLTSREAEVLELLATGHNAQEIAEALYVSLNTSRNHIAGILAKFGARSQLEAVVIAARAGIVKVGWAN